jgi:putative tryptophan/tyrosine transport system substrate-binding protein
MTQMNKRRQFLLGTSLLMGNTTFAQTARVSVGIGVGNSVKPRPRIYMVTWRGRTDAEKGFIDFWKTQQNPPEFIFQDAAQNSAKLVDIAADITRVKPDLVYAWGTPATLGLAGSVDKPHAIIGREIPLVFAIVADPVAAGLTRTLTNHGRLLTGVSHVAPLAQQMEAMRTYRTIARVGIIYNKLEPNAVANVAAWQTLGQQHGFGVVSVAFPVTNNKLDAADASVNAALVEQLVKAKINWLYLGPDSYLFSQLASVAEAASANGLATFAAVESMLNSVAPVLTGLVSKFTQVGQFAGFKAAQILRGERDVPIETLKRFSLVIRLDTAKQLGAYPPLRLIDHAEFRG